MDYLKISVQGRGNVPSPLPPLLVNQKALGGAVPSLGPRTFASWSPQTHHSPSIAIEVQLQTEPSFTVLRTQATSLRKFAS